MLKGGATYRLVSDLRGSVRLVVNAATGEVAQRLDYDAWGRVLRDTSPGFQPFGFAGGMYDPDTGLVGYASKPGHLRLPKLQRLIVVHPLWA